MRACFITGKDPQCQNDTDGANVLVVNFARQLVRKGYHVDIFTPKGYSGHKYVPKKADLQSMAITSFEPDVDVIRFPVSRIATPNHTNPELNFLNRIAISYAEAPYFSEGMLDAYDVVNIVHMAHSFGIVPMGFTPDERTVLYPMMLGSFYRNYLPVAESYVSAERAVIERIQHVQTPSRAEAESLVRDYGVPSGKIIHVPRGYNNHVFNPTERKSLPRATIEVLCANMIRPQKGQKMFLDIVREADRRGLDLRIHTVGVTQTSYNPEYNQYAMEFIASAMRKKGFASSFVFHEVLSQEGLAELMSGMHLAIYPSVTETFGKSALESVVTGLPTIVYDDVPALSEFIEHGRTGLIIPRSASGTLDAIEMLLRDKALYEEISVSGIGIAPSFSWENIVNQIYLEYVERGILKE